MPTATANSSCAATAAPPTFHKDTDATLDYIWDWSDWLGDDNDTIGSHIFTSSAPAELEIETSEATATTATVWLSGGLPYVTYLVTCSIHTMGGRDEDRTARIFCINR